VFPVQSLNISYLNTTGATSGYVLTGQGAGVTPAWLTPELQNVTYLNQIVTTSVYDLVFSNYTGASGNYFSTFVDPLLTWDNALDLLSTPTGVCTRGTANITPTVTIGSGITFYNLVPTLASMTLGTLATNNGVLHLASTTSNGVGYGGGLIQARTGKLYLDCTASTSTGVDTTINIGTVTPYTGIEIGTTTTTSFNYKGRPINNVGRWNSKVFLQAITSTTYITLNSSIAPTSNVEASITTRDSQSWIRVTFTSSVNYATTAGQIWFTLGTSSVLDITGGRDGGVYLQYVPSATYVGCSFTYEFPATDVIASAGFVTIRVHARINGGTGIKIGNPAIGSVMQLTVTEVWN
jgi:hypothetical protein